MPHRNAVPSRIPTLLSINRAKGRPFLPTFENHMAGSTFRLAYREGYNVVELCFRTVQWFYGSMDKSRQAPLSLKSLLALFGQNRLGTRRKHNEPPNRKDENTVPRLATGLQYANDFRHKPALTNLRICRLAKIVPRLQLQKL